MMINKNIDFIKLGRYIFPVSIVIMVISFSLIFLMKMNLGIDFTSGTRFDMAVSKLDNEIISIDEIKKIIEQTSLKDNYTIKELEGEQTKNIQIFSIISQDAFNESDIISKLDNGEYLYDVNQSSKTTISPKMGSELINSAALSLGIAVMLILLYITIRFNSFFALGSILALVHDISITFGIFILFNLEISLPIIAAFLTILGYSLNDTIVIFDRIRENLNLKKKDESIFSVTNKSINQTLTRTMLTSLTTLIVLTILYFVGSYLIKLFTFALIIGVIIGTYSSIFIASFFFTILYNKYNHLLNKSESEESVNKNE